MTSNSYSTVKGEWRAGSWQFSTAHSQWDSWQLPLISMMDFKRADFLSCQTHTNQSGWTTYRTKRKWTTSEQVCTHRPFQQPARCHSNVFAFFIKNWFWEFALSKYCPCVRLLPLLFVLGQPRRLLLGKFLRRVPGRSSAGRSWQGEDEDSEAKR